MKSHPILTLCAVLFIAAGSCLHAGVVQKLYEVTDGMAYTTGGLDGQGKGDIPITGQFMLYINEDGGQVQFQDVSLSLQESFNWNLLSGTVVDDLLCLSAPSLFGEDQVLCGTFTGPRELELLGDLHDEHADGYTYVCEIQAVLVPEPATMLLLGLGGLVSLRRRG